VRTSAWVTLAVALTACDGSGSTPSTVGGPTASPSTTTVGELAEAAASTDAGDEGEWTQVALPWPYVDGVEYVAADENGYVAVLAKGFYSDRSRRLFRSVDGLEWRAVGDLPPIEPADHLDFAPNSGLWVKVGKPRDDVEVSADGRSWTVATLPFDDRFAGDERSVELRTRITSVLVDGDSITVFANQRTDFVGVLLDRYEACAAPAQCDPNMWSSWGFGDDGAGNVLLYREGEVVASFAAAAELGISPEAVARLVSGWRIAFLSTDAGQTWEELTMPATSPGSITSAVGFDDTIYGLFQHNLYWAGSSVHRLDGNEWTPVDVESGALPKAIAVFDDKLYVAGIDRRGSGALWRSTDGAAWERLDVPAIHDAAYESLSASPHGLIAIGEPGSAWGPAIIEVEGLTVSIREGGVFTVTDNHGAMIAEAVERPTIGSTSPFDILDDTGALVVTLEPETVNAAVAAAEDAAAQELTEDRVSPGPFHLRFVASRDGEHWELLQLEGVLPPAFYPGNPHGGFLDSTLQAVGPNGILISGVFGDSTPQLWVTDRESTNG
jgi:hypothetical protein